MKYLKKLIWAVVVIIGVIINLYIVNWTYFVEKKIDAFFEDETASLQQSKMDMELFLENMMIERYPQSYEKREFLSLVTGDTLTGVLRFNAEDQEDVRISQYLMFWVRLTDGKIDKKKPSQEKVYIGNE